MEKKCIHDGHRDRLLNTVATGGLDNLSEVQITETLLFYILPRGDVNPLAHRLNDRFGNIANIIDASEAELMEIEGIGKRAARKIIGLNELFNKVNDYRANRNVSFNSLEIIADYFEELLRFATTEKFYLVALDHSYSFIAKKKVESSSSGSVGITPLSVATFVASTKAAGIVIAHNHPNGYCIPSKADIESTSKLKNLIESLGVKFVDHIIVGTNGIYSVERDNIIRQF